MIAIDRKSLDAACAAEGVEKWLCDSCIIADHGEFVYADENHPSAPAAIKLRAAKKNAGGPGAELHSLLRRLGLTSSGDCKCDKRAAHMDAMEASQPGWCESNIDEIVGWLRESAADRGLPFADIAARLLVRRAIANAKRKSTLTF